MPVKFNHETKKIAEEFKEPAEGIEVMEVRLYLKDAKLLWVEPIDPVEMNKTKMTGRSEYKVGIVPFDADESEKNGSTEVKVKNEAIPASLIKEGVKRLSSVAFQQNSPACSYWYTEKTRNGIVKICLY